jgi:hypothetical protein
MADTDTTDPDISQNLRTEYSELSRYFTEVIKYRFAILAFFVAGQGTILANNHSRFVFFGVLVATIGLWIIEFRTRGIYNHLEKRAKTIEGYWDQNDKSSEKRFFTFMAERESPYELITLFGFNVADHINKNNTRRLVSHSVGIDIVLLMFLLADFYKMLCPK